MGVLNHHTTSFGKLDSKQYQAGIGNSRHYLRAFKMNLWHLTVLAYYGIFFIGIFGIIGLLLALYERRANKGALKLEAGVLVMRDFAPKRF